MKPEPAQAAEAGLLAAIWNAWKVFALRAGGYQSRILLMLVYYVVLGPTVIVARLSSASPLDLGKNDQRSYWRRRPSSEKTIQALKRQF